MKAIRVLYAEDSSIDADLTKARFELDAPEIELEVARTGQQCVARLEDGTFDALLLDNHLPDMDGVDVLRELGHRKLFLPVVMVTGVGDEALVVQVLRLGAMDYVPKDGNYIQSLPTVVNNAIVEYRARQQESDGQEKQRRILYVEYNPADIDLTSRSLGEHAGEFIVEIANSFRHAKELLQKRKFDLILADLRMPDMTGLDFLKDAKQCGLRVPTIIVTGKGDETAAVAALKLGAYDYIVKRDNYLTQLPYAIENAISRAELNESNRRLRQELAARQQADAEIVGLLAEVSAQRERMGEIIAGVEGVVWEAQGSPEDSSQEMRFISDHVERLLGYSVGHCLATPNFWLSIVLPEDREAFVREAMDYFTNCTGGTSHFRAGTADGRVVWIEVRYNVICEGERAIGMRGVAVDITQRKEAEQAKTHLEEELQQARKMECIGRLAGGVAHDFNNLLTVINGYSQMMQELEPPELFRSPLEEIRRAGARATDLTRQLLGFSCKQMLQLRVLDLNHLIGDSIQMLRRLMGEDIDVVTILDSALGQVRVDGSQMNQVILNLAVNARDVMPQGGKLTLETRNVVLDEQIAQRHLGVPPGPYVMLCIRDTGCGMDTQTLSHLFEPFFTTKETGKGTGLGLSMVYGIVKQCAGSIWVGSELGHGTTFEILLPRVDTPAADRAVEPPERESPGGSETILVVEDEEAVRKLICQLLRDSGYQVIEASNANDALLACKNRQGSIPLLITDVVMPQMSGRELAEKLRELYPGLLVLYISGYTDDTIIRHGLTQHSGAFLQKPFSLDALARKIRSVLDRQTEVPACYSGHQDS
jgi:PAS domain S-box-containing protein